MKNSIVYLIAAVILATSCSELDLAPQDASSELTYWQTDEDARVFLNAIYADLMNADTYLFLNVLSDDAYTKGREDFRNIANGNYDPSTGAIADQWRGRYEGIRRTNIFLNHIQDIPQIAEETQASYQAQARFIRAWHYFYLSELYGDVPLVTDEISIEESLTLERTAKDEVARFVAEELSQAIDSLPESYPAEQQGRITRGAAMAFASRVHLYQGEYEEAAALAAQLLGRYTLFPDYGGLFKMPNEDNEEVLLSLQYVPVDREHDIQYSLLPPSQGGYANFSPLQELVNSYPTQDGLAITDPLSNYDPANPYQNRDPRLGATLIYDERPWTTFDGTETVIDTSPGVEPDGLNFSSNSTPTGYYVAKYYDPEARNQVNSGLNLIVIRYAEVLLNYAEAKIELGTFTEEDWNITIRAIRERAGLTEPALAYPGNDPETLRSLLRNERRIELAFEAGHRFFDIRRWRIAEDVLNGWAHGIQTNDSPDDNGYIRVDFRTFDPAKHYLWPVPQRERDINNDLSQNPNW